MQNDDSIWIRRNATNSQISKLVVFTMALSLVGRCADCKATNENVYSLLARENRPEIFALKYE